MNFRNTKKSSAAEDDVEVNLTPMIDMVFLLLIFFATSTTFVESPGISVDLPKSVSQESQGGKKNLVVSVDQDGKIHFEQRQLEAAELKEALLQLVSEEKDRVLVLNADKLAPHGSVVEVMDIAKQVGLVQISIATIEKKDE